MLGQSAKYWRAALGGLTALLIGSGANAATLSIRTLGAQELRLATIGYRIAAANAETCQTPTMMTGMIVHDLTQYQPAARPAVAKAFSLNAGFGVLEVVPGSEAARAGLQVDDEILALSGQSVENSAAFVQAGQSYARVEAFNTLLAQSLRYGRTAVLVRRHGQPIRLVLAGRPGCGGEIKLTDSSSINAWSDGKHVVLSTAIAQMANNDDELAFVIAHEMAHNILGHSEAHKTPSRNLFGLLALGVAGTRGEESQADAAAVPLMSAAGYSPSGGISFLESARRRMWWSVSLDHPGFSSRIRNVANAILRMPATRVEQYQLARAPGATLPQPPLPLSVRASIAG